MFFSWVKVEGFISQNPTDGIKYKADEFKGRFYTPEETKRLLRYVGPKPCPRILVGRMDRGLATD